MQSVLLGVFSIAVMIPPLFNWPLYMLSLPSGIAAIVLGSRGRKKMARSSKPALGAIGVVLGSLGCAMNVAYWAWLWWGLAHLTA